MSDSTRRDFLKTSALVGGGLLTTDLVALTRAALAADPLPAMSIARWDETTLTRANLALAAVGLTEAAMASLGGMGRFVNKGDTVWVKPNIGWNRRPELAANTNPDVVGSLVRMCKQVGAKSVKVGDHPCQPARQAYRNSGIAKAVEAAGGKMIYLDEKRFKDMPLGGEYLDQWPVYLEVAEADLVINVPILKHHGLTKCSIAMKNYMGIIGGNRSTWHQNMEACVADITQFMKPKLTVLDAVRVLTDHGPQGGDPDDVDVRGIVAASTDIVALDAFGATLLGHRPEEIGHVAAAAQRGLGTLDFASLNPVEKTLL
jgi:uncharacterized protein (DUF362 family)